MSTALAAEFAVFDKWYAAFPGPSWPNHMMSMSATSNGGTNTGDGYKCVKHAKYPQRTIFDNLLSAGHEYARIYNDSVVELYLESFNAPEAKARTQTMDRFFADAAAGTLPARRGVVQVHHRVRGGLPGYQHGLGVEGARL